MGVSECEYIIPHDEFNSIDECWDGDMREEVLVSSEVSRDFSEGYVGVNVGVHGDGIGGEERDSASEL